MPNILRENFECPHNAELGYRICNVCTPSKSTLSSTYPKYYKAVEHLTEIDVYQVHKLFDIQDPSGAIQHASKKLLLSGVRTGNKSQFKDIKEARDTLNRWLEMNPESVI